MFDLFFSTLIFVGWIGSVCVHEFGHALVAYWGGDVSVKDKGYLTLNPLKYTNIQLSFVLPLIFLLFGGIPLPGAAVYINIAALRNRLWQSAVSAGGPLATLIFSLGLGLGLRWLLQSQGGIQLDFLEETQDAQILAQELLRTYWPHYALSFLVVLEMAALVLNLLPIPPLDGYGILEPWLPRSWQMALGRFGQYGFLLVFAAFWVVPDFGRVFWGGVMALSQLILNQDPILMATTFEVAYFPFQRGAKVLLVGVILGAVILNQVRKSQPSAPTPPPRPRAYQRPRPETPAKLQQHLALLDQAIAQGGSPLSAAQLLGDRGLVLAQLGQGDAALEALAESLNQDPQQPKLWHEQGRIWAEKGEGPRAIAAWQEAIRQDPEFCPAWYDLGKAYLALEDWAEALAHFQSLGELLPQWGMVWFYQGAIRGQLHQWPEALACYDRALALSPHQAIIWLHQGIALLRLGKPQSALVAWDQALELEPQNLWIYYNKACGHAHLGQTTLGLEFLRIAVLGSVQGRSGQGRSGQQQSGKGRSGQEPLEVVDFGALALGDPDLNALRSLPEFAAIIAP